MDSILLEDIAVRTPIGVPKAEREKPQELRVTVELFHPTQGTAAADDVSNGIDYQQVVESVIALSATERNTVERFAEDIAAMLLKEFRPAGGVRVTVRKTPDLPLQSASVTIQRP